jgi:type I restriction enzyme, S subunit
MKLLEKHFDIAFSAPDGIDKLRELILTLALQGKLVRQDPDDMPASRAMEDIQVEKQRLVREGKFKSLELKQPANPDIAPYQIPKSWEWCYLDDISAIARGGSPRPIKSYITDDPNGLHWIKIGDSERGSLYINGTKERIRPEGLKSTRMVFPGDLILSNSMSFGYPYILKIEGCIHDGWLLIRLPEKLVNKLFIYHLFLSGYAKRAFKKAAAGAVVQNLNADKVRQLLVPLPPLAEQRRIVAKIDQLMSRCDEMEKLRVERDRKQITVHTSALNRLLTAPDSDTFTKSWQFITQHFSELYSVKENVAELRKAILQLAVMGKLVPQDPNAESVKELLSKVQSEREKYGAHDKGDSIQSKKSLGHSIPESWQWQCLENLLVFGPTNGFSPKAVKYETPIRSLTLTATTSGKFRGEHSKFIDDNIPTDSKLWLRDGDILVQRGNTLEYVGVSAVYRGEPDRYIYPDLMMKLRVSSEIDTDFVCLAMSSEPCRQFLRSRASGTSGTMPKINQKILRSLPIPIPPLTEQRRIVSTVDQLMKLCDSLEQHIDAASQKKTTLLNGLASNF